MASRTARPKPATEAKNATELRERALAEKATWHAEEAGRSPREKIEILLRLQREVLPILRSRRVLAPHEKPWPIRP